MRTASNAHHRAALAALVLGSAGCARQPPILDAFPDVPIDAADAPTCCELFYESSPYGVERERCLRHPEALYPVSRYVEGLLQLRDRPDRLVFLPIVGLPTDLAGASPDDILRDPRMDYFQPSGRVNFSCDDPHGFATPPRRYAEVARGLREAGAHATLTSCCADEVIAWSDVLLQEVTAALSCTASRS